MTSAPPRPLTVDVVVPAHDAAPTLAAVLAAIPARRVRTVVVVDAASRDATSSIARDSGAVVLREHRGGYGAACLHALAHLAALPQPPDAVAFVPGDGRADPAELAHLLAPLEAGNAELAIGVRDHGAPVGERVMMGLIKVVYRHRFHDLGPMRAIRFPALVALGMRDHGGGWDVEMQVRALKLGLGIAEIAVTGGQVPSARARFGPHGAASSAVSGGRSLFHILRHATMR